MYMMTKKHMTLDQVIGLMRKAQGNRSARQFAISLGVTPQYITDIYRGHRDPGPKVLAALRLKKVVTYYIMEERDASQSAEV